MQTSDVTPQLEADFLAEARIMMKLQHPNVVGLIGVCTRQRPYLMVMELLPFVLERYLEQRCATTRERFQIALGVALGMEALHDNGK